MRVFINGKTYHSMFYPIVIKLNDKEKQDILKLGSKKDIICFHPKDHDKDEIQELMLEMQ